MQFPPEVERWRATVAKYFPPELVDKALYVIQHESGGNPGAVGDGGAARGLFQIQDKRNFANRPDADYLDNPENNIRYAAEQLGGASGNFGAWGEGTTNNGVKFGALGNNPYPGDTGGAGGGTTVTQPRGKDYSDPE
ncbi:MAG: Transglycosylase domain, partial [Pseudomonadota bacterium]